MKASDITLDVNNLSFLLIGDNGSGKTKFFEGFKRPYIFDFDKGIATLRGQEHVEYDTFKDAPPGQKVFKSMTGIYAYGTGFDAFLKRLNEIGAMMDAGTCPYDCLGFDSMSMMMPLCMNRILNNDPKKPKRPEIQHWGDFFRDMCSIMDQVTSWPGIKIATAHIERAENPLTNQIELLPMAQGKFQGMMPNFFDEVYFCEVTSKPGKDGAASTRAYTIHSSKDSMRKNARTRWDVPVGTPTSWTAVSAAILAGSKATTPTKV